MALTYGFVKCKVAAEPVLQPSRHKNETQYHLHTKLRVAGDQGDEDWDSAVNVGTDDAGDLLQYRLVLDYQHPILQQLRAAPAGFSDLTTTGDLPALDFLRSDPLADTGTWQKSDVMDGSETLQPVASLLQLLEKAQSANADVYVFGRTYTTGGPGIHDVHMNQGSQGNDYLNNGVDDHNDHNDIWQDGAVIVDFGGSQVGAYFTAFTQQLVPTDDLGNPEAGSHPITDADPGSQAG